MWVHGLLISLSLLGLLQTMQLVFGAGALRYAVQT